MTGFLRGLLIVYGVYAILVGLGSFLFPDTMAGMVGFEDANDDARFALALLGAAYIAIGAWLAGVTRSGVPNTNWVKFAITKITLTIVAIVYALGSGYIDFTGFIVAGLAIEVIFNIALLMAYPWPSRRASASKT